MSLTEIFLLAVGLSMDAFAIAICKGLAMQSIDFKKMAIVGLWFGGMQAAMPALGCLLASTFSGYIAAAGSYIAFGLLLIIGIGMIREAFSKEEKVDDSLKFGTMLLLAVADSIDAFAAGVSFAFVEINLPLALVLIGTVTFLLSALGVKLGAIFGTKYRSKAEIAGGIILILLGVKVLLEGLGVI